MTPALRLAMWSGPRNISTAMMRAWGNRADTTVVDEPFYAYYLARTGKQHPLAAEVIAEGETDWRKVAERLTTAVPESKAIFYQKQMTHHLLPEVSREWLAGLTNCFLIRDPAEVIASYLKKNDNPSAEDLGFPQQREIFDWVRERKGAVPPVIDARDVLQNPKRMLRVLPNALYEIGASVTVALSLAPQLAEGVVRVRRAQRLRGGSTGGRRSIRRVLVPVLEDALDRSIALAAAMDARGYGRTAGESPARRRATAALLIGGLIGACVGMYGMLDASSAATVGAPALVAGLALMSLGLVLAGRRTRHSRYRPDPWLGVEWTVTACAAIGLALVVVGGAIDPAAMHLSIAPLAWPAFAVLPSLGILAAALPAVLAPVPPLRAAAEARVPAENRETATARP